MEFFGLTKVQAHFTRWRWQIVVGSAFLLFLILLLVLHSCGAPAEQDPLARYQPAMKPEFQKQLASLAQAPRYAIEVRLDQKMDLLTGQATIRIVNTSSDAWPYLVFRLYPMLEQYGGKLTFQSVAVGDQPVPYVNLANNS